MKRVRKAVVAGLGAAVSSVVAALVNGDNPATVEGWAGLIGGAVGLGIMTGVGVYFARNAGTVNGSDPAPPARFTR